MKAVLIVPALNEAAVVGELVRRVPRAAVAEVIVDRPLQPPTARGSERSRGRDASRSGAAGRVGGRHGRAPVGRQPGGAGLLRSYRRRLGSFGNRPPANGSGHPAGRGQRRPGPAHRAVHRRLRPVRHPHRPGPAVRRRPDAPDALPQRPAHPGPAARARRPAGGQRERHGGHRRDQVRRQRPARGAGRARHPGRGAHPALRRRRPVRR